MARSRSEEAHRRALDAAAQVVSERGVEGLTVDEVALRSGVAKTTIYRHWPSRLALAVDAFRSCVPCLPTPNTGDLRADLLACLDTLAATSADERTRAIFVSLLHASTQDPQLARLHQAYADEAERPVLTVLQLAQARGDLPADVDLELAVDLIVGPVLMRRVVRHTELTQADLEAIVDTVLAGLRAGRQATADA